jgi:hypothetical protein
MILLRWQSNSQTANATNVYVDAADLEALLVDSVIGQLLWGTNIEYKGNDYLAVDFVDEAYL